MFVEVGVVLEYRFDWSDGNNLIEIKKKIYGQGVWMFVKVGVVFV